MIFLAVIQAKAVGVQYCWTCNLTSWFKIINVERFSRYRVSANSWPSVHHSFLCRSVAYHLFARESLFMTLCFIVSSLARPIAMGVGETSLQSIYNHCWFEESGRYGLNEFWPHQYEPGTIGRNPALATATVPNPLLTTSPILLSR